MPGLDQLAAEASGCTRCRLAETRTQVVFGAGDPGADVLFVGEAPGAEEDRLGEPFVGRSGQLLDRLIDEEMQLTRSDCYIANVVKCRPPENRDPRPDEIAACRPYLAAQVEAIKPKVVVTLGRFASQVLLETRAGLKSLRGEAYPFGDAVLVPAFHPAAALRGGGAVTDELRSDLARARAELVR